MSSEKETTKKIPLPANPDSDLPPDADAEERFNEFWKNNGNQIFGAIAISALIIVGSQVYHYVQNRMEEAKRDAFSDAVTIEQIQSFSSEYSDDPLAGAAHMKLAKAAYENKEFDKAATYYEEAQQILGGSELYERALLGQAMAKLMSKDETALQILEAVASNTAFTDSTRAEADYNLAVWYWQKEQYDSMKLYVDGILALENPGVYSYRANRLLDRIPASSK